MTTWARRGRLRQYLDTAVWPIPTAYLLVACVLGVGVLGQLCSIDFHTTPPHDTIDANGKLTLRHNIAAFAATHKRRAARLHRSPQRVFLSVRGFSAHDLLQRQPSQHPRFGGSPRLPPANWGRTGVGASSEEVGDLASAVMQCDLPSFHLSHAGRVRRSPRLL